MERTYRSIFISDIHLGSRGCKADLLCDFLKNNTAETLYLVGDIIDGMTFYSSDGHPYELMIVSDITEQEWQELKVPSSRKSDPSKLETVKIVDELAVQSTIMS